MHRVSALFLSACAGTSLACAEVDDPTIALREAVDEGRFVRAVELAESIDEERVLVTVQQRKRFLTYRVLAHAGRGDCAPTSELLDRAPEVLSGRELAIIAGRSADLALAPIRGAPAKFPVDGARESIDASVCVLEKSLAHFPEAEDQIRERIERVRDMRSSLICNFD